MPLFHTPELDARELETHATIDRLRRQLDYAVNKRRWEGSLRRMMFAKNIQGSNSIEGYNLTDADAMVVAAGGSDEAIAVEEETRAAAVGYRSAMTYVLQLADDPHFQYSSGLVRSLHFMLQQYDLTKNPGRWRPGPIYVKNNASGEIVYEGPNARLVPTLTEALIVSMREPSNAPCMVRAAMAHLNLVMIHPFSDGNGRMGRILQTLMLAREQILAPAFCSIEEYLGAHTYEYYKVLADVGSGSWQPSRDARPWVRFCLLAHWRQARTLLKRTREVQRLWDALDELIAQKGLPPRVIAALADAAIGFEVRNSTYRTIADVTENLASRDLRLLSDSGLLIAKGERRGRVYRASETLVHIRQRTKEAASRRTGPENPFETEPPTSGAYLPGFGPALRM